MRDAQRRKNRKKQRSSSLCRKYGSLAFCDEESSGYGCDSTERSEDRDANDGKHSRQPQFISEAVLRAFDMETSGEFIQRMLDSSSTIKAV